MINPIKKESLPPHQKDGTGGSKTTAVADLSGKEVICKTFVPGDRMAPHHAPTDVFVLVLDGQMDISLGGTSPDDALPDDEPNRFVTGDYIVIPANMTHSLTCVETARLLIFR